MEIITGIDIGLNCTAIARISRRTSTGPVIHNSEALVLKSKFKKAAKYNAFMNAFVAGEGRITNNIAGSDLFCIESPFNISGHGQVLMEILGVVKFLCVLHKTPYVEIPQMTLKKFATGKGNAQKSDMVVQALKEFQFEAETEDEIDAFWCAQVGACLRRPGEFTKTRVEALRKLDIIDIV